MDLNRKHFQIIIKIKKKMYVLIECKECLDSAFSEQPPSLATIYRWYKKFERQRNSVQHKQGAGHPPTCYCQKHCCSSKIMEEDNKATYEVIEHQLKIGSLAFKKIIHDNLHLKKLISWFVPHHLSDLP